MACTCCSVLSVRWRVVTLAPPHLLRRCPRCDRAQRFGSSGRFRVNASGRRLDVWLVYRCVTCGATWNRPVHERVAPESLGADLARFHHNDPVLARSVALQPTALAPFDDVDSGAELQGPVDPPLEATLVVEEPVTVRLDRLLAAHLGLPRAAVAALVDDAKALRRPPRHGTVVTVDGCRRRR